MRSSVPLLFLLSALTTSLVIPSTSTSTSASTLSISNEALTGANQCTKHGEQCSLAPCCETLHCHGNQHEMFSCKRPLWTLAYGSFEEVARKIKDKVLPVGNKGAMSEEVMREKWQKLPPRIDDITMLESQIELVDEKSVRQRVDEMKRIWRDVIAGAIWDQGQRNANHVEDL